MSCILASLFITRSDLLKVCNVLGQSDCTCFSICVSLPEPLKGAWLCHDFILYADLV